MTTTRILSIHAENFLSWGELDVDLERAGFMLVEGLNGSGKSAMADALYWCLFGKTTRGYEHDEVVHRRVGEGCVVTVELEGGAEDGRWSVTRARRHKKLRNTLTIADASGVGYAFASEKDAQAEVERRLCCTQKTFLSAVVFGQDRAYRFSSLTDAEQKKILDEVLGVERFAVACAAARTQASSIQVELESGRRSLEKAEADRDAAETEATELQEKHVDFEASQRRKVEVERDAIVKAKKWLKRNQAVDVSKLKGVLDAAQSAVVMYERKLAKATDADAAKASQVTSLSRDQVQVAKLLEESDRLGGDCPTCGQKPTKRLAMLIAEAREKRTRLEEEMTEASKQRDAAATALGIARSKLKEARAAVTDAQATYNVGVGAAADAGAWRRRVVECEDRIVELGRESSPYTALVEKAEARRRRAAADADQIRAEVAGDEVKLHHAQFWVKAFGNSGLRSLLVDSSLPLLNEEAARVSRALTGGAITVEFSATSEQKSGKTVDRFEVRVDNRHGAGDYRGNSAGERAKVDLCVGLALQRLMASRSQASFNLAVFDEALDHLDSAAHEQVLEVLSELEKETVIVVSHDEDLRAWFPASMRIVKRGDFSHVVDG